MARHIVLGSEGFIGKCLVDSLRSQDKDVVGYDIKNGSDQDCRYVDLLLMETDVVYFLAWDVGGAKYLNNPACQLNQRNNNIQLMSNVFDQLRVAKSKFVFTSTQLVGVPTMYGTLKQLGELDTNLLGGHVVRLCNVYGAYEDCSIRSHVISDFIHQALKDGHIHCSSTGYEMRQFIHVSDICQAIQMALICDPKVAYEISSFEYTAIRKLAHCIGAYLNVPVSFGTAVDTTKITVRRNFLPRWKASIDLEDGLLETIKLYQRHLNGT